MSSSNDLRSANVTNNADGSVTITFKQSIIKVVAELPAIGESDIIYLKAQAGQGENNLYSEHIFVNGKWEDLGVRNIDLSSYLTKTEAVSTYSKLGHTHSYTSLTDLPSIVQIAAQNYDQFKDAVKKLQGVVGNGGFGEIIQTGDWVVTTNETPYNMKSISIKQVFGMINISNGYMNLLDAPLLERLYFIGYTNAKSTDNKKAIELSFTKSSFTRMLGCTFDRCLCSTSAGVNPITPTIVLNNEGGTPSLFLDDWDAGTVSMPASIRAEKMIIETKSKALTLFVGRNPNKTYHVTRNLFVDCKNTTVGTITNDIYYNVTSNGLPITPANREII